MSGNTPSKEVVVVLGAIAIFILNILFLYYPILVVSNELETTSTEVDNFYNIAKSIYKDYEPRVEQLISKIIYIESKLNDFSNSSNLNDLVSIENSISNILSQLNNSSFINTIEKIKISGDIIDLELQQTNNTLSSIANKIPINLRK